MPRRRARMMGRALQGQPSQCLLERTPATCSEQSCATVAPAEHCDRLSSITSPHHQSRRTADQATGVMESRYETLETRFQVSCGPKQPTLQAQVRRQWASRGHSPGAVTRSTHRAWLALLEVQERKNMSIWRWQLGHSCEIVLKGHEAAPQRACMALRPHCRPQAPNDQCPLPPADNNVVEEHPTEHIRSALQRQGKSLCPHACLHAPHPCRTHCACATPSPALP